MVPNNANAEMPITLPGVFMADSLYREKSSPVIIPVGTDATLTFPLTFYTSINGGVFARFVNFNASGKSRCVQGVTSIHDLFH